MNQILSTNEKSGNSILGLKPIVRFFAIILIIMALIFIGQSGYRIYSSTKYKQEFPRAELQTEQFGSVLNLKFSSEKILSRIDYSWNDGNTTEVKGIGKANIDIDIDVPPGENKLKVSAVDVDGNKTKFEEIKVSYTEDDVVYDRDRTEPEISIEKSANAKKFVITVKDNKELDYISYYWEGEQPTVVNATEETKTELVEELAAQKGTKTITVKAVDKAGNESTKSRTIVGSEGPKITVSIKDNNFVVKVTSENDITRIVYLYNETEEHEVENIPKNSKEFEFKVPLKDGENKLKINAYEEDIMTEYKCKKTK
jgi:hypothetical protein